MQLFKINCAALCALFLIAFSQLNALMYRKGQQDLHLGIGLGSTLYGSGYRSILPPLNVSYEKGLRSQNGSFHFCYASFHFN